MVRLWDQIWCLWGFLPYHRAILAKELLCALRCSSIPTPLTLRAQSHQAVPTSDANRKFRVFLGFWPLSYKWEVPIIIFLGSINLLERLTELRKAPYSLDHHFVTKDIKGSQSTARCRLTQGEAVNKGASVLLGVLSPAWWHISEGLWFTNLETPCTLSFWAF